MNNNPLVSIIVPAYNAENYIKRCVDSICKQTYENWELIIINDGSKDNTEKLAVKYSEIDSRIRVFTTENKGVSSARNIGIDMAAGEFLMFTDVDDELERDALSKLYSIWLENQCDIVIGQCTRIKGTEVVQKGKYLCDLEVWEGNEGLKKSLEDYPATYSVWGKLYRRECIGTTRFIIGRKVHEDSYFLFELLSKSLKVVIVNEYVYHYHITSDSASRAEFSDKFFDIKYLADRKIEKIKSEFPEFQGYIPNIIVKANMALLNNLMKTTDRKYNDNQKQLITEVMEYKKHYIEATRMDRKLFFIITHHLYWPYKFLKNLIR